MDLRLIFVGLVALVAIVFATFAVVNFLVSRILALILTPKIHRRYGQFKNTDADLSLRKDGYSVTALWKSDAVANLPKN